MWRIPFLLSPAEITPVKGFSRLSRAFEVAWSIYHTRP